MFQWVTNLKKVYPDWFFCERETRLCCSSNICSSANQVSGEINKGVGNVRFIEKL